MAKNSSSGRFLKRAALFLILVAIGLTVVYQVQSVAADLKPEPTATPIATSSTDYVPMEVPMEDVLPTLTPTAADDGSQG